MLGWTVWFYRIMKGQRNALPPHIWIINLIPPSAVFFLITLFDLIATPLLEDQDINIYGIGMATGLIFFLSHHYSFYLYIRQGVLHDLQIQTQILQSQIEAQTRQNKLIEEAQKQAGEIRHEIKNLLFALQIELDRKNYEGIKTRIAVLLGDLKQYEQKSYTGIPIIDAMISYKGEKLREYGAKFSVTAELFSVSDMFAYDVASLLAIALDNAADALAYETARKEVLCAIKRRKNLFFMQVYNPLPKSLK